MTGSPLSRSQCLFVRFLVSAILWGSRRRGTDSYGSGQPARTQIVVMLSIHLALLPAVCCCARCLCPLRIRSAASSLFPLRFPQYGRSPPCLALAQADRPRGTAPATPRALRPTPPPDHHTCRCICCRPRPHNTGPQSGCGRGVPATDCLSTASPVSCRPRPGAHGRCCFPAAPHARPACPGTCRRGCRCPCRATQRPAG